MPDLNIRKAAKIKSVPLVDKDGRVTCYLKAVREIFEHNDYSPYNILNDKKNVPPGLSSCRIWDILKGQNIKSIRENHLEYILKEFGWRSLREIEAENFLLHDASFVPPEEDIIRSSSRGESEGYPSFCTDHVRLKINKRSTQSYLVLKRLRDNTKMSIVQLVGHAHDLPCGLSKDVMGLALSGRKEHIEKHFWDYIFQSLHRRNSDLGSLIFLKNDDGTPTYFLKRFREEFIKNNIVVASLLKGRRDIPSGISVVKIQNWLAGNIKSDRKSDIYYVLDVVRNSPNSISTENSLIQRLKYLREVSGVSPRQLLEYNKEKVPEGLKANIINGWLKGQKYDDQKDWLEFVISSWEGCARQKERFKPISGETLEQLRWYKRNTKISSKELLVGCKDFPQGFKIKWVEEWLSGKIKEADETHIDYVLSKWKDIPIIKKTVTGQTRKYNEPDDYVFISQSVRKLLNYNRTRTGMGSGQFLEKHMDFKGMLRAETITDWMTGRVKKAPRAQLDFVLERWNTEPDKVFERSDSGMISDFRVEKQSLQKRGNNHHYIELDKDVLREMRGHRRRTGKGPKELLAGAQDLPFGLNYGVVVAWLDGDTHLSDPRYIDFVLDLWRSLPSR